MKAPVYGILAFMAVGGGEGAGVQIRNMSPHLTQPTLTKYCRLGPHVKRKHVLCQKKKGNVE